MDDPLSKIPSTTLSGYWTGKSSLKTNLPQDSNTFQDVLSTMMLMSNLSSMGQGDESSAIPIAPLMMMLIEKMLSGQIEYDSSASSAPNASPTAAISPSAGLQQATPVPHGWPASGPITQGSHPGHVALDIGIVQGTSVRATMDGKVVYAGWNDQGYGNLVIVENGPYRTYYGHLSKVPVSVGQEVTAGTEIGLSGTTGNSTGPHLHYEVRENQVNVDPNNYL
jgi:murein DD-endopeptidase MepM/ murein hydrolase activator NlpD